MAINKLNYNKCIGSWENPYKNTRGIQSFDIYQRSDKTYISITGKEAGIKPGSWGESEFTGFAQGPDEQEASAYQAFFDLGFADALLAINENKGLLVILAYISPKTETGQSNYFIREFYYKK